MVATLVSVGLNGAAFNKQYFGLTHLCLTEYKPNVALVRLMYSTKQLTIFIHFARHCFFSENDAIERRHQVVKFI